MRDRLACGCLCSNKTNKKLLNKKKKIRNLSRWPLNNLLSFFDLNPQVFVNACLLDQSLAVIDPL